MARRHPSRRASSKIRQAVSPSRSYFCESLEQRLLFVVLHGGDTFEFFAENNHYERVVVTGPVSTTVELIGSHIDTMTGAFTLNQMQGVLDNTVFNGGFPNVNGQGGTGGTGGTTETFSDSIFAMYVSQSDFTSSIAVADVPDPMTTPRPMQPFDNALTFRVRPTAVSGVNPPFTVTGPTSSGGALIGARSVNVQGTQNQDNIPITQVRITANNVDTGTFLTLPAPAVGSFFQAGLVVAPGNDLNQFMFGGAITGQVNIHGSVNQFYAGWLLTGVTAGEPDIGSVSIAQNFNVDGNLGSLITPASIGTENDTLREKPDYSTGFDMRVGGILGEISSQDAILGNVDVSHSPSVPPPTAPQSEVEFRGPPNADPWDRAILGNQGGTVAFLNNDTFETAQFLGSVGGDTVVDGALQDAANISDFVDYYGVALLAGQTVTVQLTDLGLVAMDVGVFDPTGRLIATDYSNVDPTQTVGEPFQFTADRPGTYRFAVAESINPDFIATPANTISNSLPDQYELAISNTGDIALGGIFANGNILDNPDVLDFNPTPGSSLSSMIVENGDLGSVYSHGIIFAPNSDELFKGSFTTTNPGTAGIHIFSYSVPNGNLRAVEGAQIGFLGGVAVNDPPTCFVPHGSVGYLHTTDATGLLGWNIMALDTTAVTLSPEAALGVAIGGDYQFIDAANQFFGDLVAVGNIGTIRAGAISTDDPSYFQVNAGNDANRHGIIDLVDSATSIGALGPGGPAFITGPGGDVRYVHVGPYGTAFRDAAFGSGAPEETIYQPGETADITDDSGSVVHLTPVGTPGTVTTAATPGQLTVLTLPVRGSGGSAIVRVSSTIGLDVTATGPGGVAELGSVRVGSTGTGGAGTAVTNNNTVQPGNQGQNNGGGGGGIITTAAQRRRARRAAHKAAKAALRAHKAVFIPPGQPGGAPVPGGSGGSGGVTTNPNAKFTPPTLPTPPSLPATATPLTVTFNGPNKIDVYEVTSPPVPPPGDGSLIPGIGQVTALTNNTPGEIVNIHLNSLGAVTTNGSLGVPVPQATPCAILGAVQRPLSEDGSNVGNPWDYPFLQPTNMIRVLGNIVSISAAGGVGNVYAGFIRHVQTGDPIPVTGTPIIPNGNAIDIGIAGNIGPVSGKLLGPLVAAGSIASVSTPGTGGHGSGAVGGAGIYAAGVIGPVVSNGDFSASVLSSGVTGDAGGIISISVNGVITSARISSYARFDFEEPRTPGVIITGNPTTLNAPRVEIAAVQARDGIIGTLFAGDHIGTIGASDAGFGIFATTISVLGDGTLQNVSAGGYGLRADTFDGGARIGSLVARGDGSNVPTTNFPASVRRSETGAFFDPNTGMPISLLNDIDLYLGTVDAPHQQAGVSDTGVIEDSTFVGSRDLGSVSAWSIRGRSINTPGFAAPDPDFTEVFSAATTTMNFANRIGTITTTGPVRGLAVTTGRTTRMQFGSDVAGLNMTVAGPIGNLVFNGNLLSDSFITAQGPAGRIGSLTIHGSLQGGVRATGKINKLRIDGNLVGNVAGASLGTLSLGGGIGNGTLTIDTNVKTIQTDGDFGVGPSSVLTINGSLQNLKVGRNFNGTLNVGSNLRNFNVNGSIITGTAVKVGNTLTLMKVGGDFQAGATVTAHIIRKKIVKGQDLGTLTTT